MLPNLPFIIHHTIRLYVDQNSSVGIATRYRPDGQRLLACWGCGFEFRRGTWMSVFYSKDKRQNAGHSRQMKQVRIKAQSGSKRIKKIRVGTRFSAPVQTGRGAHPASCTTGTGSFPGIKRPARGVDHLSPSTTLKPPKKHGKLQIIYVFVCPQQVSEDRVVRTPDSYLGLPGFKSRPEDRLTGMRFFSVPPTRHTVMSTTTVLRFNGS